MALTIITYVILALTIMGTIFLDVCAAISLHRDKQGIYGYYCKGYKDGKRKEEDIKKETCQQIRQIINNYKFVCDWYSDEENSNADLYIDIDTVWAALEQVEGIQNHNLESGGNDE